MLAPGIFILRPHTQWVLRGVLSFRGFLNLSYIGTAWRLLRDTGGWVPLWELLVRVSGLECEGPVSLASSPSAVSEAAAGSGQSIDSH